MLWMTDLSTNKLFLVLFISFFLFFFFVKIKTCKFAKNTSKYWLHSWKMEKIKRNAHRFHVFYWFWFVWWKTITSIFVQHRAHMCRNSNVSEKNVISIECWANLLYSLGYGIHLQFENADSIAEEMQPRETMWTCNRNWIVISMGYEWFEQWTGPLFCIPMIK